MSSCNNKVVPQKDANAVNDVAYPWNPILGRVDAKGCTNMLQHTLQHTGPHCNTLQHTLQHIATRWNTLQHAATHYSTATDAQGCMCVEWLIHTCDMTHAFEWHDSFTCVTWLIHMCDMTHSHVWHDSFICVIWLIHMCDMTHSYVWHDSFICATWLISYVWHDSFRCVTWLINMCDMIHSYVCHDSFMCVTCLIHMQGDLIYTFAPPQTHSGRCQHYSCVPWLIQRSDMTLDPRVVVGQ